MSDTERTPLSGNEYAALLGIFGMVSTFETTSDRLKKRAQHAAPGTWRDLRLIAALADRVMDNLLATVPEKKLAQIHADVAHVRMSVKIIPPWVNDKTTEGFSYVSTEVLNDLLNHIIGNECRFCGKTAVESRRCPHRKTIEAALPHTVPGTDGDECKFADIALGLTESRETWDEKEAD